LNVKVLYQQESVARLIHPAGFRTAIFLVHIIGGNVVAIFVEGSTHGTILLAHEHFELARRPPPLPSIVGIPNAEIMFRRAERETALGHELHVQEPEQQSAEMSEISNVRALS
jgi:hypothetical protein